MVLFCILFNSYANSGNEFKKNHSQKIVSDWMSVWSHSGSNQGPADYESAALTDWAMGPSSRNEAAKIQLFPFPKVPFLPFAK